ncbi:MAG: YnfA family protein [Alphaproteobacteria bacterium]|jgi:small multidrug resistance family-3 protein|nr:YnfA family protein [Alphaproteobacteria bacterium]
MKIFLALIGASIAEIAGCFSFWTWMKLEKTIFWLIPGTLSLWVFAYLLTYVESDYAGRAYAAYGAVYIFSSILWMHIIEGNAPDRFDVIGVFVCLIGASIILFGPRG